MRLAVFLKIELIIFRVLAIIGKAEGSFVTEKLQPLSFKKTGRRKNE